MLLNIFLVIAKRGKGVPNIVRYIFYSIRKSRNAKKFILISMQNAAVIYTLYSATYIWNDKSALFHIYSRKRLSTPRF